MTRTKFVRISVLGAAVAVMTAGLKVQPARAAEYWWASILTPRNIACLTVGCPTATRGSKCAEVKGELSTPGVGSLSVTWSCYFPEPGQPSGEDEM
jgi:hypothetical protein